ncbi:MAG: anaerobic sulfatase maturase [Ruminococcaceae bacterium]|nr:anaerobic sulfatase maturase [Oscillospiraceae bacterium]
MPPLSLLIKPASGSCNMRCEYCFYIDETENRAESCTGRMSPETVQTLVDKALSYAQGDCTFAFQGGEPTLAGLEFYRHFAFCADSHPRAQNVRIHYSIQTNGYSLNEEWAKWFAERQVLVGISLDGPKEIHDRYRVDHAGKGTFNRVMASIRLLEKYNVDFNILTVISGSNARHGHKVYDFFKKNNFRYQQYIECLDPIGEIQGGHEYSLTPEKYETFLKSMFDCWYQDMKNGRYVYNRYFENLMMIMAGQHPEGCNFQGFCSPQWVIEADGSVYPCDFYALDPWLLGNINTDSFEKMEQARKDCGFVELSKPLPDDCKKCKWLMLCRNGCRRNREPLGAGCTGKNYFCTAYQNFLEYAYPRLKEILQILRMMASKNQ